MTVSLNSNLRVRLGGVYDVARRIAGSEQRMPGYIYIYHMHVCDMRKTGI